MDFSRAGFANSLEKRARAAQPHNTREIAKFAMVAAVLSWLRASDESGQPEMPRKARGQSFRYKMDNLRQSGLRDLGP